MNALQLIKQAVRRLGYRDNAVLDSYRYDDLSSSSGHLREARLAVFTQTPASYRSAAFGVAVAENQEPALVVGAHRALGAPLFFVIEKQHVSVWQVFGEGPARMLERENLGNINEIFERHEKDWSPESIHRAKSIGKFDKTYQLDFVDVGLLPAIEGQIHEKLDRLLNEVFAALGQQKSRQPSQQLVFQGVFRLLAAKILIDRGHNSSKHWNVRNVGSVLNGIGQYYSLSSEKAFVSSVQASYFADAWEKLQGSFNVANISADDLAYVYENTLVTPAVRQQYGTHSTPRQVADFIAAKLRLWDPASSNLHVYEPCTGAGVLLVAALRHMRSALPEDWTDHQRHAHLVKHLRGSEVDGFACEVATLSMILADYPNTNGWKITQKDLFEDGRLAEDLKQAQVVLCNPPFEALNRAERKKYPEFSEVGGNKAETVLKLTLQAKPQAIGFVLPRSFLMDNVYSWHRKEIESRYSDIEIVSLPDRIFNISTSESALIIARNPSAVGSRQRITVGEVDDTGRLAFLEQGITKRTREVTRVISAEAKGNLWLPPLTQIWQRLSVLPKLGDYVDCHWGIRWRDKKQNSAASDEKKPNTKQGLMVLKDHRQFVLGRKQWLNVKEVDVYGAGDLPWTEHKILCNAIRSSRGPWRISAAVDRSGLVASQQFAAMWAIKSGVDLDALSAIINGPLGNAFMFEHSADRRLRIGTLLSMPIPSHLPEEIGNLARQYARLMQSGARILSANDDAQKLLDQIDALVLEAYGLPPTMVRSLLAMFIGQKRPVVHDWESWRVKETDPALTLAELRSEWVRKSQGAWFKKDLPPAIKLEKDLALELWGRD